MSTGIVGTPGGPPPGSMMPKPGQAPTYTPEVDPTGQNWNRPYATPKGNPNIPPYVDPTGGLYQANWDANRWQGPGLPPHLYQPTYVTGQPTGPPVTDPNLYDKNGNYRGGILSSISTGQAAPTSRPTPQAPAAPAAGAGPQTATSTPGTSYTSPGFSMAAGANPIQQAMQQYQTNLRASVPQQYQQYIPANFGF